MAAPFRNIVGARRRYRSKPQRIVNYFDLPTTKEADEELAVHRNDECNIKICKMKKKITMTSRSRPYYLRVINSE